ncbi:MAG TPA: YdcF family protein [Kiritimatiellia bacterium]|nr:YdcF family protein [Kiritimatiellia bacterium]
MKKTGDSRPSLLRRLNNAIVLIAGYVFIFLLLAALLGLPWKAYNWLSMSGEVHEGTPDVIVLMGGGGIPSESGLTRAWQTAREAARYPKARVIVAMPYEEGEGPAKRGAVQTELILRGVSESRLDQEGKGRHTREQAELVHAMLKGQADKTRVMVVTSPEHVRRSVLAFRKAGFVHVRGRAVFSQELQADLAYGGEPKLEKPSAEALVGNSMMLRYRLWDNLLLEIKVTRELVALAYYRLKGWI